MARLARSSNLAAAGEAAFHREQVDGLIPRHPTLGIMAFSVSKKRVTSAVWAVSSPAGRAVAYSSLINVLSATSARYLSFLCYLRMG